MRDGAKSGRAKLRFVQKNSRTMIITVPSHIGVDLEPVVGKEFHCQITDEGILFTLVPDEPKPWIQKASQDNGEVA